MAASPASGRTLVACRLEASQVGLVAPGEVICAVVLRFGDTGRVDWDIDWGVLYYELLRAGRIVTVRVRLRVWTATVWQVLEQIPLIVEWDEAAFALFDGIDAMEDACEALVDDHVREIAFAWRLLEHGEVVLVGDLVARCPLDAFRRFLFVDLWHHRRVRCRFTRLFRNDLIYSISKTN